MAISKRTWREDLSRIMGDWTPVLTSGAGNAGGTTFPSTGFDGYATNTFRSWWAVSQTLSHYRLITAFAGTPSPATWTVTPAFGAPTQIASAATLELHVYRPDYYTEAARRAIRQVWPYVYRPNIDSSLIVPSPAAFTILTSSIAVASLITTSANHGLVTGQGVTITGHSLAGVNGTWPVTVTGLTTFTIPYTNASGGTGGTATVETNIFAMPSGITPEMVTQIMMEGAEPFAGRPYHLLEDVSYNDDGTVLWLNRTNRRRYRDLITGRKIYIFAQKYLTAFARDATYGTLDTDTSALMEVDTTSAAYELLLAFGKWAMFDLLSEQPQNQLRGEHRAAADRALQAANAMVTPNRMPVMESPFLAS